MFRARFEWHIMATFSIVRQHIAMNVWQNVSGRKTSANPLNCTCCALWHRCKCLCVFFVFCKHINDCAAKFIIIFSQNQFYREFLCEVRLNLRQDWDVLTKLAVLPLNHRQIAFSSLWIIQLLSKKNLIIIKQFVPDVFRSLLHFFFHPICAVNCYDFSHFVIHVYFVCEFITHGFRLMIQRVTAKSISHTYLVCMCSI